MGFESFNQPAAEGPEGEEQMFSKEGLLNRNFKKNRQQSEAAPVAQPEQAPATSVEREVPIMAQMVETYKSEAEPERAAFDALYDRLDPNLSVEDKLAQMRGIVEEYEKFKQGLQ